MYKGNENGNRQMVQENSVKKLIVICGPTASGKSDLAVEVAKLIDGEIISADSMNVYSGLDIGTAKPTAQEKASVPHYLIDVVTPDKTFSVGDYREMAIPVIEDIFARGKVPVICGGTGFYIKAVLFDYSYGKTSANTEVREKFNKLYDEKGSEYVYEYLKSVDKKSAEKLHPNDKKRVVRAIEIYESGVKKSELNDGDKKLYDYNAYSIDFDRDELYNRIEKRVDKMFDKGLEQEVKNLLDGGVKPDNQCMQGIGYKEFIDYFDGKITLEQVKDNIKLNTRHYAKRQITFFKKLDGIKFLHPTDIKKMAEQIVKEYKDD